ncbi:MAG: hypothetical protein IKM73_07760 [Acidaminococcaceae bacterium]|nr:hypothetical protein [Acidaminococcaceae bacterium]
MQILMALLFLISWGVFAGLLQKKDMWAWICLYWLILTVKNAVDFMGAIR